MSSENQSQNKQGNTNEINDQSGGTTNLPLNQLKKEGGISNSVEDNPDRLNDEDDLNEIRAADDLDEPNIEEYQPDNSEKEDDTDVADENQAPSDID